MMNREELIVKIADLYIENSDGDGSWEPCDIIEAVMSLLVEEGRGSLLTQCGDCSTWYPLSTWDSCPYWDSHPCSGRCGNTNEECSCDDCPDCHIYYEDCECPHCTRCGEKRGDCSCPEEEAVFA